ncbi:MAG: T9SS C-terminal target domain-containing protein [Bacteroidetes bacterium]|nr:MAG: T9SS C-terminal target domain-containing protein [Bacteroidota bacterium]
MSTLTLTSANTYTGATTVSGGALALGIANALSGTTAVTLNGGTLSTTGAFNQSVGTLNLAVSSTISLFGGSHNINFAASDAITWNGTTLTITGWQGPAGLPGTSGKLFVGSSATGLTQEQLAKISFSGYCTGAAQLANGEVVPKAVLPTATVSATANIMAGTNRIFDPANNCRALSAILPSGVDPVAGNTTTQVWVEGSQPTNAQGRPFAKRHYEITPANNAANATGTVTLYFLQSEFDNFNDFNPSGPDMPSGPSDVLGISNLRIYKYAGSSSNGTGLPDTYAGTGTLIDPADANIVWNAAVGRWEITFDVVGFSGFFVTNANFTILPLSAVVLEARQQNGQAVLNWSIAKAEPANYQLQRSSNGQQFSTVHAIASQGAETRFTHSDALSATTTVYYRVVATHRNGTTRISNVAMLKGSGAGTTVSIYPNPITKAARQLQLSVSNNTVYSLRLLTATGVTVLQKAGLKLVGSSVIALPKTLSTGTYFLQLQTAKGPQVQRVVVE